MENTQTELQMDLEEVANKLKLKALNDMFERQAEFQRRVDPRCFSPDLKERVDFIMDHSLYMEQELQETLYELPYFKRWKDYSNMTNVEKQLAIVKAQEELIDTWHFFMNIALSLGFTADTFYQAYLNKIAENNKRQDEGYTHDKSFR